MSAKPILMSAQNPEGITLEDLLSRIRDEIFYKNQKVVADDRPVAVKLAANNRRILQLLSMAEEIQRESIAALSAFAPDQGPTGTPRVGIGSTS